MRYNTNLQKNPSNKRIYNRIDEICSLDLAGMIDSKTWNNKAFGSIIFIFDNFWKYTCSISLKKNSQTVTDEVSNILTKSTPKPIKIESDRAAEFYDSNCQFF